MFSAKALRDAMWTGGESLPDGGRSDLSISFSDLTRYDPRPRRYCLVFS